jgi:hypothetical protein
MPEPSQLSEVAWQERCFITISKKGASSDHDFHGFTEEISFSGGEKGVEGQPLLNGGRFTQFDAQSDIEYEMTIYKIGVSPAEATGIEEFFYGSSDNLSDQTGQFEYETSLIRDDFRVVALWTNDEAVESAVDAVSSGKVGYRRIATGAKLTNVDVNFDDQVLQAEITFTIPPFDAAAESQERVQEQTESASAELASLGNY